MTRTPVFTFLLAALLTLGGCGGDDQAPTQTNGPVTASNCYDSQRQQAGEYMVENNVWNKGTTTGYMQCVGVKTATTGTGVDVAFEWLWPGAGGGIRSYPEVIYGQKPWNETTTTKLPRVVDAVKTAKATFAYTLTHTPEALGAGNLTFDIWLTLSNVRSGTDNSLPRSHELMIVLDKWGGYGPFGTKVDTVVINGVTWDLYTGTGTWGTAPWTVLTYMPTTPIASPFDIDIRLFLDHLKQGGRITGKEWLASIELGNEVISGAGSTRLKNLTVTVE